MPRTIARRGYTLLEVIIAMAIFVGALAIISKLVEIGTRNALFAQLQTRAIVLAQSKMAEIEAGIQPLTSAGAETFQDDPAWQWQLETVSGPASGLILTTVTVFPATGGEVAQLREPVRFRLSRWLIDPSYQASVEEEAASTESTTTGSMSGTGTQP